MLKFQRVSARSTKEKIWDELEPVLIHSLCGFASEVAIGVFGLGIIALRHLFADEDTIFKWMEKADLFAMLIVIVLFSTFVVLRVLIRGTAMLKGEMTARSGLLNALPVKDQGGSEP